MDRNSFRKLNLATWSVQAQTSVWGARGEQTNVVVGNNLILMGGYNAGAYKNDVWISGDSGVTWNEQTASATWPVRADHSSVVVGNNIITMGGHLGAVFYNDVWLSANSGSSWTIQTLSAAWGVRSAFSLVVIGNNIILTGGWLSSTVHYNDVWISGDSGLNWSIQTASAQWSVRSSHTTSVVVGNSIILMGGVSPSGIFYNDVWKSIDSGVTWNEQTASAAWHPRSYHSSLVFGNYLVLMGGTDAFSTPAAFNDVWMSSDSGVTWNEQTASAQWSARVFHSTVVVGNNIILLGGQNNAGVYYNDVWISAGPSPIVTTAASQFVTTVAPSLSSQKVADLQSSPAANANVGAIVGGVLGGILFVVATFWFILFFSKKNKSKSSTEKQISSCEDFSKPSIDVVVMQQEDESARLVKPSNFKASSSYRVCFINTLTKERFERPVSCQDTVGIVKRSLFALFPHCGSFESMYLTLGPSVKLSNETSMDDKMFFDGMTIYINYMESSPPRIDASSSSSKPQILDNCINDVFFYSIPQKLNQIDNTDLVFQALSDRTNLSGEKRKEAKNLILNVMNNGNRNSLKTLLLSKLKEDSSFQIKSLSGIIKKEPWFSEVGDDSMFEVGASKSIQRNSFFTLIGDLVDEDSEDKATRGLIKPINLLGNGTMEGVNAVIFKANIENSNVVIKCMIPLNDGFGYESHFSSQEFEFSIPMSLPPHPNVIPILHQFTASSVLVYPWISKDLRDISEEIRKINGKGIIKRQTTYVVLDYYPSTLRKKKKENNAQFTEKELILIALQLFKGVSHLSENKIAHRDLKDDNVFLQKDGTLTIADFGCAVDCNFKLFISKEDVANRLGAPAVTAPEVFYYLNRGPKKIDHEPLWKVFEKSDVFSIGALLYRLVDITALPSVSNDKYKDDIPQLPPTHFSGEFIAFMRSLLAYHPRDRPTAKEAVRKLEMLLFSPKREVYLNNETIENWLLHKRLNLFFNIPNEEEDGTKGLDAELLNAHHKAMLEFFINVEVKDFIMA